MVKKLRSRDGEYELRPSQQFTKTFEGRPKWSDRWYATVRCQRSDGLVFKNFVGVHRAYRTLNAAKTAATKHRRVWERFVKLSHAKGNRIKRLQNLVRPNKLIFMALPCWVARKADGGLIALLTKKS